MWILEHRYCGDAESVRIQAKGKSVLYMYMLFSLISDLKIKVGDKHISAHKFVLAARSDTWSLANLASTEELDLSGQSLLRCFSCL